MKILHIMPYSPFPPNFGGALRMYYLLRHMAKHHEVTVVSYGDTRDYFNIHAALGEQLSEIHLIPHSWAQRYRRVGQFCALWTGRSFFHLLVRRKEMQNILDWLIAHNQYDIVLAEFSLMGGFDLNTSAVRIMDAHNVEYDNFRRWWLNARSWIRKIHYHREYLTFFREEIESCKKQDALFVTSERDKVILDEDVPNTRKFVLPNGVDTTYFMPSDQHTEPYSLVFTGMMAYVPNYDGILYFLDEIFPLVLKKVPQAKIYVVGNRPPGILTRRASGNVIVTGYVEDVRPFVWKSKVYVVPLRMGGGTRLKVLEAMAMRKPIVTTSIGCEGINVKDGESALIRDNPESFAEAVVDLLLHDERERNLIQNGYALVRSTYDWSVIGKHMDHYFEQLRRRKAGRAEWMHLSSQEDAKQEYTDVERHQ